MFIGGRLEVQIGSPTLHRPEATISPEAMAAAEVTLSTVYERTRTVKLVTEDEFRARFQDDADWTIWAHYDNYSHRIITSRTPSTSKHKETFVKLKSNREQVEKNT